MILASVETFLSTGMNCENVLETCKFAPPSCQKLLFIYYFGFWPNATDEILIGISLCFVLLALAC